MNGLEEMDVETLWGRAKRMLAAHSAVTKIIVLRPEASAFIQPTKPSRVSRRFVSVETLWSRARSLEGWKEPADEVQWFNPVGA